VHLAPVFNFHEFISLGWLIPDRRRVLKPLSSQRTPQVIQVRKCDLLVQVVSAKNIPMKITSDTGPGQRVTSAKSTSPTRARAGTVGFGEEGEKDDPGFGPTVVNNSVNTFVEVRFQESSSRTSAMPGNAPIWKQTLKLPFRAPQDDFSPSSLQQVRDEMFISVFDEVMVDDVDRGGFLDGEGTERTEKRFLGSISIPFSTICQEGKIEGIFRVKTPAFNW
jgi:coiled-coil and C2 domain-containing protein 2A